jgi:hypothetical protein
MDLDNYVSFGTERKSYLTYSTNFPDGQELQYDLTVPVNAKGRVQGVELSYQQAITDNFGRLCELHLCRRQADVRL